MTKILRIERCDDCPHLRFGMMTNTCRMSHQREVKISYGDIAIPDWCPLPDAMCEDNAETAQELRHIAEQIVGGFVVSFEHADASDALHAIAELLDPGSEARLMAYAIEEED